MKKLKEEILLETEILEVSNFSLFNKTTQKRLRITITNMETGELRQKDFSLEEVARKMVGNLSAWNESWENV